jgi:hypothetical protein
VCIVVSTQGSNNSREQLTLYCWECPDFVGQLHVQGSYALQQGPCSLVVSTAMPACDAAVASAAVDTAALDVSATHDVHRCHCVCLLATELSFIGTMHYTGCIAESAQ